jgi:hypothetical protein
MGIILRIYTKVIADLSAIGATRLADRVFRAKARLIRALVERGLL